MSVNGSLRELCSRKGLVQEEVSEIEERCKAETIKKATIEYAYKSLAQVEKLEAETRKIKRKAEI